MVGSRFNSGGRKKNTNMTCEKHGERERENVGKKSLEGEERSNETSSDPSIMEKLSIL